MVHTAGLEVSEAPSMNQKYTGCVIVHVEAVRASILRLLREQVVQVNNEYWLVEVL